MDQIRSGNLAGKTLFAAAQATLLLAMPFAAQIPLLHHGAKHEKLGFLIGRWRAQTKRLQPVRLEVVSETVFSWRYGGVYLQEHDRTAIEGTGTIHNVMLMTYNERREAYVGAFWDNVNATIVQFQARWRDEQTLELDTGDITFGGRPHRIVVTYTKLSETRMRKELRWSWDKRELELAAVTLLEKTG